MTLLGTLWLGIAGLLIFTLRKAGPWWRVALGALAWPALPFVAAVSKFRHAQRRRAQVAA